MEGSPSTLVKEMVLFYLCMLLLFIVLLSSAESPHAVWCVHSVSVYPELTLLA